MTSVTDQNVCYSTNQRSRTFHRYYANRPTEQSTHCQWTVGRRVTEATAFAEGRRPCSMCYPRSNALPVTLHSTWVAA